MPDHSEASHAPTLLDPIAPGRANERRVLRGTYAAALLLVIVSVLTVIAVGEVMGKAAPIVAATLEFAAIVAVFRVSGVRRVAYRTGLAVALVALLGVMALNVSGAVLPFTVGVLLMFLLTLSGQAAVIKRLATYRAIDFQFVLGLLVVYVLIGLAFAYLYLLVELVFGSAFTKALTLSSAEYYSYITLATVGYGDISPVNPIAQSLAVGEAIFGQLYLVSVVSIAVGSFGRSRFADKPSAE